MRDLSRRRFLQSSLLCAATACSVRRSVAEERSEGLTDSLYEIVDTHAYLRRWPFESLTPTEPGDLLSVMRTTDVKYAWVGNFEGLLHKDIEGVNQRLFEMCRTGDESSLIPFGTVNPMLPDWEEDLRRCDELYKMPGIRLHPNFHGYSLDDPTFSQLLKLAAARNLVVQLVVHFDYEEKYPPFFKPNQVDLNLLPDAIRPEQELRLVISNLPLPGSEAVLKALASISDVYFSVSGIRSNVSRLLKTVPPEQIIFGSSTPLFPIDQAVRQLKNGDITRAQTQMIASMTARQLMARRLAERRS